MKSVIYQLGFDDFPRIRVGAGAPEGGRDLIAHVMSMPTGEALDKGQGRAATMLRTRRSLWYRAG